MADNLTTTTTVSTIPNGTKISTDEDATNGHVQRVKLAASADGSSTHIGGDADGLQVQGAAADGAAVAGNPVLVAGTDGTNAQTISTTAAGVVNVDASGTAVPVTDNGGSLTVDGTVTANAGTGTFTVDGSGVTQPVSNTAIDNAHSADYDTGAGTDTTSAFGIAVPASGGAAVVPGDATAGLKVDLGADNDVTVTGTVTVDGSAVTQPVSGTVTANLGATDNAVLDQIEVNTSYGDNTGGGVEAGALRVTIANDSTGVVSVDDNGSTLSVDDGGGALTVDNGGTFAVQADSVTPGTAAANLGKAIDTAAGATDTGVASLAVRDDTLTTLTPADGDYVPLRVNSTGALHVTGAGGGTQYNVDDAGPTVVTMAGAVRDDTLTTLTEVDGDATLLRVNSQGALHVTGGGGGTEYTDDTSTHATGSTVGNAMMAAATPTDSTVDANDMGVVAMSTDRRLHVDAQIVGQDADVTIADGGNVISVDDGAGSLTIDNTAIDNAHSADFDTGAGTDTTTAFGIAVPASGGAAVIPGDATAGLKVDLGADNDVTITGVVSVDDNAGSLTVDNAALSVTGGGVEASALRVTIANDSTGVVSIDDNGSTISIDDGAGSITVDGTVSISGTVTVDSELPAAAALATGMSNPTAPAVGAFAMVYNGATWDRLRGNTTGIQVQGGTAHDAVDAGNPVKVGGKAYETDGTAPGTAVAENDRANFITDRYGRQLVGTGHPNAWTVNAVYTTAQTDVSVKAAPGAGLSLYITDIVVSTDTAFNCFFEHGTTKIYGTMYFAANGGSSSHFQTPIRIPANTALTFTSSATANHSITVNGYTAP